jgi:hypothetical protein
MIEFNWPGCRFPINNVKTRVSIRKFPASFQDSFVFYLFYFQQIFYFYFANLRSVRSWSRNYMASWLIASVKNDNFVARKYFINYLS